MDDEKEKKMIKNTTFCPFCGSEAHTRKDRVKTKINGITINLMPKNRWFCDNCKHYFKYSYEPVYFPSSEQEQEDPKPIVEPIT
jgi:hypothetical protein